ncbi:hypothetical protein D3C83_308110 [compost metagenome]
MLPLILRDEEHVAELIAKLSDGDRKYASRVVERIKERIFARLEAKLGFKGE